MYMLDRLKELLKNASANNIVLFSTENQILIMPKHIFEEDHCFDSHIVFHFKFYMLKAKVEN